MITRNERERKIERKIEREIERERERKRERHAHTHRHTRTFVISHTLLASMVKKGRGWGLR